MNIEVKHRGDPLHVAALRARNDRFRRTLTGGTLMRSAGVIALGAANQASIIAAVRAFTGFGAGDPFDDHSIGDLEVEVDEPGIHHWPELIFFRVDDLAQPATGTGPSPTPASSTALVLSLMLASEW